MYYPKNDFQYTGYNNEYYDPIPNDTGYYKSRENISNINIPKVSYAFNKNLFVDSKELPKNLILIDDYSENNYGDIFPQINVSNFSGEWSIKSFTPRKQYKFILKHFPEHIESFLKLNTKTLKTRFFLCLYLYIHGGVYVNNKYSLTKPLDECFNKDVDLYFMTQDSNNINVRISWDFLASRPLCPFWLTLLPYINNNNNTNFKLLPYTYHIIPFNDYLQIQKHDKIIMFYDDAVNTASEVINYQLFIVIIVFILLFAIFIYAST